MDVSAEQQTLSWIPVQESLRLGRAVYLHNGSKWFAKGKRLVEKFPTIYHLCMRNFVVVKDFFNSNCDMLFHIFTDLNMKKLNT